MNKINTTGLSGFCRPVLPMASAVAAALGLSVASPVTLGQESLTLEEVIVTATRRMESIQDVPISVTAIGEELQKSSLRRLDDIQSFTPNVYLR